MGEKNQAGGETQPAPNTLFVEVSGAGLPEVDGLFVPSTAPPAKSESGTVSTVGYWNGKPAWDRADGKLRAITVSVLLQQLPVMAHRPGGRTFGLPHHV